MVISDINSSKWLKYGIWLAIVAGVLLRLAVYLQAISPYNDEACVIRNIYERDYAGLTQTLDYYQYAPPVFLWIIKASTDVFGFSEYALRIYPFLCGVLAVFLLYSVLKKYSNNAGVLYALLLFAAASLFIRYTTAVKQYMPDLTISLCLTWLALHYKVQVHGTVKLFVIWVLAGSLAVWSSMPSVFVLAAVGLYYLIELVNTKDYNRLWFIVAAGLIWLVQFALYYLLILKPQADSEYLQNFHKLYFFYWPTDLVLLNHNISLFFKCVGTAGGMKGLSLVFNSLCIVVAVVYLFRTKRTQLVLALVPVGLMLLAAAMHQYTLVERVTLFAMPFYLILIGTGFGVLFQSRFALIKAAIVVIAIINFANHQALRHFVVPMEEEDIKKSLAYLQQQGIEGNALISHQYSMHAYTYYTVIHPDKEKYADIKGAGGFTWNTNLDSIALAMPNRFAVLYSWDVEEAIQSRMNDIKQRAILVDSNMVYNGRVYIFKKKIDL